MCTYILKKRYGNFVKNNYATAETEFTDMQIFNTVYTEHEKLGDFNEVYSFGKVH